MLSNCQTPLLANKITPAVNTTADPCTIELNTNRLSLDSCLLGKLAQALAGQSPADRRSNCKVDTSKPQHHLIETFTSLHGLHLYAEGALHAVIPFAVRLAIGTTVLRASLVCVGTTWTCTLRDCNDKMPREIGRVVLGDAMVAMGYQGPCPRRFFVLGYVRKLRSLAFHPANPSSIP